MSEFKCCTQCDQPVFVKGLCSPCYYREYAGRIKGSAVSRKRGRPVEHLDWSRYIIPSHRSVFLDVEGGSQGDIL